MAEKNKGGRPKKWTDKKLQKIAADMVEFFRNDRSKCFISSFFAETGISRQRVYHYENSVPELAEAFDLVRAICETRLAEAGLSGTAPPAMAIFSLKQFGWKDKVEVDSNHSGGISLNVEFQTIPDSDFSE